MIGVFLQFRVRSGGRSRAADIFGTKVNKVVGEDVRSGLSDSLVVVDGAGASLVRGAGRGPGHGNSPSWQMNILRCTKIQKQVWSYSVMVSILDSESSDPSSILGKTKVFRLESPHHRQNMAEE